MRPHAILAATLLLSCKRDAPAPPAPPKPIGCILRARGDAPVPVFPTAKAFGDWTGAASDEAAQAILLSSGARLVTAGAKCERLEAGLMTTRVRVLDGPSSGADGFVATEWAKSE